MPGRSITFLTPLMATENYKAYDAIHLLNANICRKYYSSNFILGGTVLILRIVRGCRGCCKIMKIRYPNIFFVNKFPKDIKFLTI